MPAPYITNPDADFVAHLTAMMNTSNAAAIAALLQGQRQWMYPPLSGWSGDPTDIIGMNEAFNRDNLNQIYINILQDQNNAGTIGESMVAKLQIDYIAALERAFRTRHCSSVRARIHAAARRSGHGSSSGLFLTSIKGWIEDLIEASHPD